MASGVNGKIDASDRVIKNATLVTCCDRRSGLMLRPGSEAAGHADTRTRLLSAGKNQRRAGPSSIVPYLSQSFERGPMPQYFWTRVDMRALFLVLSLVPALTSVTMAQGASEPHAGLSAASRPLIAKPYDTEGAAAKARAAADAKYRRINQRAKAAVDSMCSECLGGRHNQSFEKAPLTLPDELSEMVGTPQLEIEP